VRRRREPRRVVREGYRVDVTTMALERLDAGAAASIPDPDGLVVRRRREPRRVVREGYRADRAAMAHERLEAGAPTCWQRRMNTDPARLLVFKKIPCQTTAWTEQ
jgi:hypothetical protein